MTDSPPAGAPPDLSVILVNWNGLEVTSDALTSLREHTAGVTYEVFVIDNGSTKDASAAELPARFPWVAFLANPANLGFTRANNQGIRRARGRYVLLLNNDTVQTENALGEAVRYMDAHPAVGALGILHRNNDAEKSLQPSFFAFPKPLDDIRGLLGWGKPAPAPRVTEQDADWVCGSFLLIRRACLEQVGPLDERYFAYDEDIDWCRAAKRAGWVVRFWPGVSMIHLGSGAASHLRDKNVLMYRSHLTYLRKNHSLLAATAYYVTLAGRLVLGVVKAAARVPVGKASRADVGHRWRRFTQFILLRSVRVGG